MALGVTLDPQEDLDLSAQTVAMWPLRVVDLHQYLEGQLQPFLEGMESTPHIILASAGSPIEEQLSMSWGYRPISKWGGNLRRYCPDRFWASMRHEILLREADRVRIERERQEQRLNSFRVTATLQNSASTTIDASGFTISSPRMRTLDDVLLQQQARAAWNFNDAAQTGGSRWMPIVEDDVDPDEEPDVDYHDDIDDDDYDYDEEG